MRLAVLFTNLTCYCWVRGDSAPFEVDSQKSIQIKMLKAPAPPASIPFNPVDTNMRMDERRHSFMQDPGVNEARKRRELFTIELRSKARSDHLYKRRLVNEPKPTELVVSRALAAMKPELTETGTTLKAKLVALKEILAGNSEALKADALTCLRELSMIDEAHDIICKLGIVVLLKNCLEVPQAQVVEDSSFVITSLSSGVTLVSEYLSNLGIAEALLRCVTGHNLKATENSLWALCNIMNDIPECRVVLLNKGVIPLLHKVFEWYSVAETGIMCILAWTVSQLSKGVLSIPHAKSLVGLLKKLMVLEDKDVEKDAIFALSKMLEGDHDLLNQVLDLTVVDYVTKCLHSRDLTSLTYALGAAISITAASAEFTQHLLASSLLTTLKSVLGNDSVKARASALICLYNIAIMPPLIISQLICHDIIAIAAEKMADSASEVRTEALNFVEALVSNLNLVQRLKLIFVYDVLRPFKVALSMWSSDNIAQLSEICSLLLETNSAEERSEHSVLDLFESSGCYDELFQIMFRAKESPIELIFLFDEYFADRDEASDPSGPASFNFS